MNFLKRLICVWALSLLMLSTASSTATAQNGKVKPKSLFAIDTLMSGGKRITVERFLPPPGRPCYPALVFVHGVDGMDKAGPRLRYFARRWAVKGYVVLIVHYYQRTGTSQKQARAISKALRKFLIEDKLTLKKRQELTVLFKSWADAVRDTVSHARELKNVRKNSIGVVGFSLGGFLATHVASKKDANIAAVVALFGGLAPITKVDNMPPCCYYSWE